MTLEESTNQARTEFEEMVQNRGREIFGGQIGQLEAEISQLHESLQAKENELASVREQLLPPVEETHEEAATE